MKFDSPSDFRDALPTLRKLWPWLSEREKLNHRIAAMKRDAADFSNAIKELNTRLGGSQNAEGFVLAQDLQSRLNSAQQANRDLQTLQAQIQEQEKALASVGKELVDIGNAVQDMAQVFPNAAEIKTTEDLMRAVSDAQKAAELREEITKLQRRITLRLGQDDFDSTVEILGGKEIPGVSALLQAVKADLSEAEKLLKAPLEICALLGMRLRQLAAMTPSPDCRKSGRFFCWT